MTSPEDRIKELARKSAIDPADAERLLAAVKPARVGTGRGFNPFERWSGEVASILGLVVAAAMVGVSRFGLRTNGTLDVQRAVEVPITTAVLDQLAAFPLSALVFWGVARIAKSRGRLIDMLGVVGLARAPAVVAAAVIAPFVRLVAAKELPSAAQYALSLVVLGGIGFHVVLLVLGFRTASGLRGSRLTLAFLGALVAAELVSKVVLDSLVPIR